MRRDRWGRDRAWREGRSIPCVSGLSVCRRDCRSGGRDPQPGVPQLPAVQKTRRGLLSRVGRQDPVPETKYAELCWCRGTLLLLANFLKQPLDIHGPVEPGNLELCPVLSAVPKPAFLCELAVPCTIFLPQRTELRNRFNGRRVKNWRRSSINSPARRNQNFQRAPRRKMRGAMMAVGLR